MNGLVAIWIDDSVGKFGNHGQWGNRLIWADIEGPSGESCRVSSVHLPARDNQCTAWIEEIEGWIEESDGKEWLKSGIIGGDFNMVCNPIGDWSDGSTAKQRRTSIGLLKWKEVERLGDWVDLRKKDPAGK